MDPVAAVRATTSAATTATDPTAAATTPAATTPASKDFASFLKDGESLHKLKSHSGFEKIEGGKRDGEYLNMSGNKRNGQAFAIERTDGKEIHVYGKLKIVVGKLPAATTPATGGATAPATTTPVATTPVATTPVATTPVATTPVATTTPATTVDTTTDDGGGETAPDG